MQFLDIKQNTDEWLDLRIGKLTGSGCATVMANYGKAFGDPAKKLAVKIAVEQLTGKRSEADSYSNSHMQRGHDQEPQAIELYENLYFVDVQNGGFFDCGNTGCSPDGRVLGNGIIEVKSVIPHVHYANIKRGDIDPAYKWQINFNLLKTEKDWIDSISYCADFPENKKLYVHRLTRKDCEENFKIIKEREKQFFKLIEEIKFNIGS